MAFNKAGSPEELFGQSAPGDALTMGMRQGRKPSNSAGDLNSSMHQGKKPNHKGKGGALSSMKQGNK